MPLLPPPVEGSPESWENWLKHDPPVHVRKLGEGLGAQLDSSLGGFAFGKDDKLTLTALSGLERAWVRQRSDQLGIECTMIYKHSMSSRKQNLDMVFSKPKGWVLPFPIKNATEAKAEMDRKRKLRELDEWKEKCDDCGALLDAKNAFFHWGGLGPLCEKCILGDPELEPLKWESWWYIHAPDSDCYESD